MRAYSPDLRARIVAAVDAGTPQPEVAHRFEVSLPTVKRYMVLRRTRPSLAPLPVPGRPTTIRPDQEADLWTQLVEHPTAILAEHCALWEASHGIRPSLSTMSRAIRKLGWTRKKEQWVPPSGTRVTGPSGIG
jgi:transposase